MSSPVRAVLDNLINADPAVQAACLAALARDVASEGNRELADDLRKLAGLGYQDRIKALQLLRQRAA